MNTDKHEKLVKRFELVVAILLGLTAVLTAYASWQSSLYDGNQAEKYTNGTKTIADANQLYNEASQYIAQDMQTWNELSSLRVDLAFAQSKNDADEAERVQYKINYIMYNNVSDEFAAAINWADAQADYASPFEKEGYAISYYEEAQAKYDEGDAFIAAGTQDNNYGDKLGLVTVIFAIVLFMLGIVATFNNTATKLVVSIVSIAALVFGVISMLGVPYVSMG
jgi:hypothetical protein